MKKRQLIVVPDERLNAVCEPVSLDTGSLRYLRGLVADMQAELYKRADGVAIAAPQVADLKRLFIMSGRVNAHEDATIDELKARDTIFINPTITWVSPELTLFKDEGCLSIPGIVGDVRRHSAIKISAFDLEGKPFQMSVEGFVAQILQHETDHLDGILFTQKAEALYKLEPKQNDKK